MDKLPVFDKVPFLNANIQAKAILAEALIKRPQQTIAKITTKTIFKLNKTPIEAGASGPKG